MNYKEARYEARKQLAQIIKNKIGDDTGLMLDNGMIVLVDQGEITHNYFVQELDNRFIVRNQEVLGDKIIEDRILAVIKFNFHFWRY